MVGAELCGWDMVMGVGIALKSETNHVFAS